MAHYADCIRRVAMLAGRALTDDEIGGIYERVHKAALDVRAGRVQGQSLQAGMTGKATAGMVGDIKAAGKSDELRTLIQEAAQHASAQLEHDAALQVQQAELQLVKIGARLGDYGSLRATGIGHLDAIDRMIARRFDGKTNIKSLEQVAQGHRDYFGMKLDETWSALGNDFLGFFQDEKKLLTLVRELRGEDTGDAVAKAGAKAFHDVAEEARQKWNDAGGDTGLLPDWGMPQHHSQAKVAAAGRDKWVNDITPMLDPARYVDTFGMPKSPAEIKEFLEHAYDTISTDGLANIEPGQPAGFGKRANRHAEARQIHFKDAESYIAYWKQYGERSAVEILNGHMDTMGKDIAFIEYFGPNPNMTYQTLRDTALKEAVLADPRETENIKGKAQWLDRLYDYAAGRTGQDSYRPWLSATSDALAHLNAAGKGGGFMLASLFGDKVTYEAVSHLDNVPAMQRWGTELRVLNPANRADHRALQREGLMLESMNSSLQRFYEGLGKSSTTGKWANLVMRITGMTHVNAARKGGFGLGLMSSIGGELSAGREFADLPASDVRTLRHMGISNVEWKTWQLAELVHLAGVDNVLTPTAIASIPDDVLRQAGVIAQVPTPGDADAARRDATIALLGAVNTEADFAIVTPGWRERAKFFGGQQRGTAWGEISRSVAQFKTFPYTMFGRGMDLVSNAKGPAGKATMTAFLIVATTAAGAMLMQTREVLSGRDPRSMADDNWMKFWGAAFLQGGALGIYGDFLYSANQSKYGSGILEAMAGPTIGPLLELGVTGPTQAIANQMAGKDSHYGAVALRDLKGIVPGSNLWYVRAALDHLVWMQAMEWLSPGYMQTIRQRTARDYNQEWWWNPGDLTPARAPAPAAAVRQ